MILDQPPAIIGQISLVQRLQIGCAALWLDYRQGEWAETIEKNISGYQSYMQRCMNGEPVAIHIKVK